MKTMYKSSLLLLAAILFAPVAMRAQSEEPSHNGFAPDGVQLHKTTTEVGTNKYQIDLEAYVTGKTQTIITEKVTPADIILVLDCSSSMTRNNVTVTTQAKKGSRVSTGTQLSRDKQYIVVIDGEEYILKMFRRNYYGDYRYYVRYKSGVAPDDRNDGRQYGNAYYTSAYTVAASDEIYEYTPGTTKTVTRFEALQMSSQQFVQSVFANSPDAADGYHKVAIVCFNKVGNTVQQFTDVNSTNLNGILNRIGQLSTSSASSSTSYTNPASGLYESSKLLDGVKNDGRNKVVVFFTDGTPCPSGTNNFSTNYAIAAVNMSYVLKQPMTSTFNYRFTDPENSSNSKTFTSGYGAKVYSVAILSGQYDDNTSTKRFLHFCSSNYPDQLITNGSYNFGNASGPGSEAPANYFQLSDGADLSDIFAKIAYESSKCEASYSLSATSTTVIDVLGVDFRLQPGMEENVDKVQLFLAKPTSIVADMENPTFNFEDESNWINAKTKFPDIKVTIDEEKKEIKVSGYDFSANYVSQELDGNGKPTGDFTGYKLIIRFPIEIDPNSPGGADVETNQITSGIYVDGEQIAAFNVPHAKIPNLVVIKKGLHKGESATFTISRADWNTGNKVADYPDIVLVATCNEEGEDAVAKVKIQVPGRYTVTESTWSWAYDLSSVQSTYTYDDKGEITDAEWNAKGYGEKAKGYWATIPTVKGTVADKTTRSITRNVNDFTEDVTDPANKGTLFIFTNVEKSENPAHAEAINNNEFYESRK